MWGPNNAAKRLICGHSVQGCHRCKRYITEICQLRRNSRFHYLSDLHSPANQFEPTASWPTAVGPCVFCPKVRSATSNTGSSRNVVLVVPCVTEIYPEPRRCRLILIGPLRTTQGGDATAEACLVTLM
jgi:hypothetical protein